jgi:hypothetical protein
LASVSEPEGLSSGTAGSESQSPATNTGCSPLTPAAISKAKRFDWTEVNKLSADLATAWSKAI